MVALVRRLTGKELLKAYVILAASSLCFAAESLSQVRWFECTSDVYPPGSLVKICYLGGCPCLSLRQVTAGFALIVTARRHRGHGLVSVPFETGVRSDCPAKNACQIATVCKIYSRPQRLNGRCAAGPRRSSVPTAASGSQSSLANSCIRFVAHSAAVIVIRFSPQTPIACLWIRSGTPTSVRLQAGGPTWRQNAQLGSRRLWNQQTSHSHMYPLSQRHETFMCFIMLCFRWDHPASPCFM